jgi:hypothetical protein
MTASPDGAGVAAGEEEMNHQDTKDTKKAGKEWIRSGSLFLGVLVVRQIIISTPRGG